jgi:hypothetical protein
MDSNLTILNKNNNNIKKKTQWKQKIPGDYKKLWPFLITTLQSWCLNQDIGVNKSYFDIYC